MRTLLSILFAGFVCVGFGQFPPAANQAGTTAIHQDSSIIIGWASAVVEFQRGFEDIAIGAPYASYGDSTAALGYAEGNSSDVVSLGDAGSITLTFDYPITDDPGFDFAIFENSFAHEYLELAHVEVSTDGINFVRIPSESQVQTSNQTGPFMNTQANEVHNLAGKYIQGYGTPFDLADVADSSGINVDSINFVKLIDVVGVISGAYASYDALGTVINDPYPTAFESSGFDLDGIAVIHDLGPHTAKMETTETHFLVYPNPTNDVLKVAVSAPAELVLTDLNGRLLYKSWVEKAAQISLMELGLSAGIYLVHVNGVTRKLVLT